MSKSIIDIIGREKSFKFMEDAIKKAQKENEKLNLPKADKIPKK